jgi:hypothetical protein
LSANPAFVAANRANEAEFLANLSGEPHHRMTLGVSGLELGFFSRKGAESIEAKIYR